ncbi:MAG: hypothetical protein COU85_01355 [Candidatus Portnoybacteria bacterium CG10_big_fil_rev_8_21_14_0_10_44_7]|uniref:UDP-N-acetylmuramoyl-tripeptide--D-alanyl-D-alanine ligase n=1 Tax=Candidatus Portnoybacteria bacterium CG10_big_fil_rev_8_21_14_0_10_44_7 TaxID=1974816 RepID=A0A2M8KIY0_9BACT|nr:MAG: hypothetical protein COU85_01355 [Candidatus Portnoybacteria bacterium CG10_big_fil_rev_8_21_14_0_10_44_7]
MGKTSTREAIYAVLKNHFSVRRNVKNYNNEIGLPLTILGLESGGRSLVVWLLLLCRAVLFLFYCPRYPKILILEMGVDQPGDMDYLLSIVRPHLAVITGVGKIPVHVEFFSGPRALAREKGKIIRQLSKQDFAILNIDDELVAEMGGKTKAKVITYGFSDGSSYQPAELDFSYALDNETLLGIHFKISAGGQVIPFQLRGVLGRHQLYAALAAVAVGKIFNLNLVEISNALRNFPGSPGRMRLLDGVLGSFIIDDTYNASPSAVLRALETLDEIPVAGKKIAVLGDMLELGGYAQRAHQKVGEQVLRSADIFIAVGPFMKIALQHAKKIGFAPENLYFFQTSADAGKFVEGLLGPGDLVLVKGSQSMRMEKVVLEIMAYPENARQLLVRQDKKWQQR